MIIIRLLLRINQFPGADLLNQFAIWPTVLWHISEKDKCPVWLPLSDVLNTSLLNLLLALTFWAKTTGAPLIPSSGHPPLTSVNSVRPNFPKVLKMSVKSK